MTEEKPGGKVPEAGRNQRRERGPDKHGPRVPQLGICSYDRVYITRQQHCRNSISVYLMVALLL
jgi:hypothetical protein